MDRYPGAVRDDICQQDDPGHQQRKSDSEHHTEHHDIDRGSGPGGEEFGGASQQVEDGLGDGDGGDRERREDQIDSGCLVNDIGQQHLGQRLGSMTFGSSPLTSAAAALGSVIWG